MSKAVPREYGRLIRAKRMEIGASLRGVADHMDVSHVFVADVETGKTATFRPEREAALLEALPNLTREELAEARYRDLIANGGRVVMDWRLLLARNLRDAAGCELAWTFGNCYDGTEPGNSLHWASYKRKPAPGWED